MTNSKMEALARQLVASPRWRWLPGMRSLAHPYMLDGHQFIAPRRRWSEGDGIPQDGRVPDLSDAATLGCLLQLVREAWGRPHLTTKRNPVLGWIVVDGHDDFLKSVACDSEAEALASALLAAPA